MSDYRVQMCQITGVVFYTTMFVNDIFVGIREDSGVRLERFSCRRTYRHMSSKQ